MKGGGACAVLLLFQHLIADRTKRTKENSMSWRGQIRSKVHHNKAIHSQEVGVTMFRELRNSLTLWYRAVLGVALVLFGVLLYFGTQYFLLSPVISDTQQHAIVHQNEWYTNSVSQACPAMQQQGQ